MRISFLVWQKDPKDIYHKTYFKKRALFLPFKKAKVITEANFVQLNFLFCLGRWIVKNKPSGPDLTKRRKLNCLRKHVGLALSSDLRWSQHPAPCPFNYSSECPMPDPRGGLSEARNQ